mmetsp:Transcript_2891/g.4290  ORF Transcript_2891/g.4290 Transcript_2891/m.4290 type:complete len:313 (-) Transcript_2891:62-1000(-)|eukprot:CAMPEP_0194216720 /NCGR_PEP_ID=MMETSP0156-20130528/19541_1 /TAXON_ID=33649 /ORGANISM="Thalassionema nitzschioides, Strain L26-B" /LENGTH=312 /DNA_ID=CAMNT_0038945551 /DNA_START=140 /DNA_END=1081 /DNA_ORIENTATION=+
MDHTWSINATNVLHHHHHEAQVWQSFTNHHAPAVMLFGALAIGASYSILHRIFSGISSKYEHLNKEQQLQVVQQTMEVIFRSLFSLPLLWFVSSLFFEEKTSDFFATSVPTFITIMFLMRVMYWTQIASSFFNMSLLDLVLKLCTIAVSIYPAFFTTTAAMKMTSVLMYFSTYEVICFIGLVMYRLAPTSSSSRWTRTILMTGMVVFGLSRPLQLGWIVGNLVTNWDCSSSGGVIVGHSVFQIVLTTVFTALQLYSLTIYWNLYKKCGKRANRAIKIMELEGGRLDIPLLPTIQEEADEESELMADVVFCVC